MVRSPETGRGRHRRHRRPWRHRRSWQHRRSWRHGWSREVVITRAGHEPVVIVSLDEYQSLRETAYLMRSPANARRLIDAMEELEAGRGVAHELILGEGAEAAPELPTDSEAEAATPSGADD